MMIMSVIMSERHLLSVFFLLDYVFLSVNLQIK